MPNKMIYLNDEMYSKVSNEENASGLISSLLEKHYNNLTPVTMEEKRKALAKIDVVDPRKVELREKLLSEIEQVKSYQESEEDALRKKLEANRKEIEIRVKDEERLNKVLHKLIAKPTKEQINQFIFYSRNYPKKAEVLVTKWIKDSQSQ